MKALVKFSPIIVLETFDGDMYFTESDLKQVIESLNSKKFVVLNDEGVACSAIKNFYPDICGFSELTRWQLKELIGWKKQYREKSMKEPQDELIIKKISRIRNGQKLT